MNIKIGDRVKFQSYAASVYGSPGKYPSSNTQIRYGIITGIRTENGQHYYEILDNKNLNYISLGWSITMAPHMGDVIELDLEWMRDEKLKKILYV